MDPPNLVMQFHNYSDDEDKYNGDQRWWWQTSVMSYDDDDDGGGGGGDDDDDDDDDVWVNDGCGDDDDGGYLWYLILSHSFPHQLYFWVGGRHDSGNKESVHNKPPARGVDGRRNQRQGFKEGTGYNWLWWDLDYSKGDDLSLGSYTSLQEYRLSFHIWSE